LTGNLRQNRPLYPRHLTDTLVLVYRNVLVFNICKVRPQRQALKLITLDSYGFASIQSGKGLSFESAGRQTKLLVTTYNIVIPARYASNRFPGKPLFELQGKAMILHTVDRARESEAVNIVVATDDDRIRTVCENANVDVHMTRSDHPTGTDRIAEVVKARGWGVDTTIVGLQGDEPTTPASHLDLLAANLEKNTDADMATLCMKITSQEDFVNSNRVKVVRDHRDMALYFSRAPIPWRRDEKSDDSFPEAFLHLGLYAYRCEFLNAYSSLSACAIENEERLEQLRVLYHGGKIHVGIVPASIARGVDHPDDVPMVEAMLARLQQSEIQ